LFGIFKIDEAKEYKQSIDQQLANVHKANGQHNPIANILAIIRIDEK
jgi:hypothetical protein